jgi:SAM-dependent methyltransferase
MKQMSVRRQARTQDDYHQYVFNNGRLVGDFERMYRESTVVPWRQDESVHSWWSDIAVRMLEVHAPYETAIEVGCGLGYFADRVSTLCRSVVGVDISPTAVRKARAKFPHLEFRVLDVRKPLPRVPRYDLVIVKDLFWYVFPALDQVVGNLQALTATGGRLFLFQSFPNLKRPFIGKRAIPDPDALMARFLGAYTPEYSCQCRRHLQPQEGPMTMALLCKASRRGRA